MPSLMAARQMGQNSGPIFLHLWTKVHQIKFACAGVSIVCNADVLLHSGDIHNQVAKLSKIAPKV